MNKDNKRLPSMMHMFREEFEDLFPADLWDALFLVLKSPDCRCPMLVEIAPGDEVCLPRARRGRLEKVAAYQISQALAERDLFLVSHDVQSGARVVNHLLQAVMALFFGYHYPAAGKRIRSVARRRPDGTMGRDFYIKGDPDDPGGAGRN
jgi:hypothetical protein